MTTKMHWRTNNADSIKAWQPDVDFEGVVSTAAIAGKVWALEVSTTVASNLVVMATLEVADCDAGFVKPPTVHAKEELDPEGKYMGFLT